MVEEAVEKKMKERRTEAQHGVGGIKIDTSIFDLIHDKIGGKPKTLLCRKCYQECQGNQGFTNHAHTMHR